MFCMEVLFTDWRERGRKTLNPSLIDELQSEEVNEVIIATNATAEGQANSDVFVRLIRAGWIKSKLRLAQTFSSSDIEYADELQCLKLLKTSWNRMK